MSSFLKLSIELREKIHVLCLVAGREIHIRPTAWEKEDIGLISSEL